MQIYNRPASPFMQNQRTEAPDEPTANAMHSLTESQFDAVVAGSRERQRLSLGANVFDADVVWPLGGGHLRYLRVQPFPGVTALYCDFRLHRDIEVTLEPRDELLVSFFLSGALSGTTVNARADLGPLEFRPAHTMVRLPNRNGGYAIRIPASAEHRFVQLRLDRHWLIAWLRHTRATMPRHLQHLLMSDEPLVLCNAAWSAQMRASLTELSDWKPSDALFAPRFYGKSVELMTLFSIEFDSLMVPSRSRSAQDRHRADAERVQIGCRLIDEHPADDWRVASLATTLHWSATAMQLAFRRHTGTSVHDYIRQRRLALGSRLLHETQMQVSQIAAECGWRCSSRFSRAFLEMFGETPSAYRAKRGAQASP